MWAMAQSSIALFFAGKLFAEPAKVYRQLAIGVVVTAILMVAVGRLSGQAWVGALVAGLIGGALQPWLFKDLRYR